MDGTWTPRLDDKFRLTLPKNFREELTDEVMVVCEQERCLAVYPKAVRQKMMEPYNDAPSTLKAVRDYQRWAHSRTEPASPDKQGRIILTPKQREWAGVEHDVVVIGVGTHMEVWNPERWEEYSAYLDDTLTDFNGEIVPRT